MQDNWDDLSGCPSSAAELAGASPPDQFVQQGQGVPEEAEKQAERQK